jgi:glucokinase
VTMNTYRERVHRGTARATVLRTIATRERRSHLSAPRVPTVGIDIGGTKVMAGVVDADGVILEQLRAETPDKSKSPKVVEDVITELVLDLSDRHDVHAVGIGAAGWVDADRSQVLFAPHLAWRNEPLRAALATRLAVPILVDNDANAAAWGEWRFGAGRGEDHLVMITLGTGIGGAILEDGRVKRGTYGVAGEFGHMQVVPGGHRCPCGNRGCWEQYSSGNALVREARELAAADSPVAHTILERVGGRTAEITGPLITELAREGDAMCVELLEDIGRWLGVGLANLAAALDPARFVIGGGGGPMTGRRLPVYVPKRPPHVPRRRWLTALVVVLLIAVPLGYAGLSAAQSRDSGEDKARAAAARSLVYEWPSKVQRRIYDVPIPDGSTYVGHYETNRWEQSTLYVQFRTSPQQLGRFLEDLGATRAELSEGTVTIAREDADVVGWTFEPERREYAGLTLQQSSNEPEVAITVDVTKPERPRVYVVSTTAP